VKLLGRAVLTHRGWRYKTRVDPDEIRWLRGVLRPGDVAVDVGAYKGGYTYWMRRAVRDTGSVFAFEPQPAMAAYLRQCVHDFDWMNVRIEDVALSSGVGTRRLQVPGEGPSPGASLVGASLPLGAASYEVRTNTLDRYWAAQGSNLPVRLIKCDVEGHEIDVFRGAARVLEDHRPLILFECEARHLRGHSMRDVFGHLEEIGYRGSFFWKGERLDVGTFDVARYQVEGRRPYGNNFIFEWPETVAGS
jgi:FkbM family methyltransferase